MAKVTERLSSLITMARSVPFDRTGFIKQLKWIALAVFCFFFFIWVKLPETRIKALINGHLSSALSQVGITYSARESDLSIGFGIDYQLRGVSLYLPSSSAPIMLEEVHVTPILRRLIFGTLSAAIEIKDGDSEIELYPALGTNSFNFVFDLENVSVAKFKLTQVLADVRADAVIDMSGKVSGEYADLKTVSGKVELDAKNITIYKQSVKGFKLPEVRVSKVDALLPIEDGKIVFRRMEIGNLGEKPVKDDIAAKVSGKIELGNPWMNSTLDLKAVFAVSEKIQKAFVILDALLGAGKREDGHYAFKVTGRITNPFPSPDKDKD